MYQGPIPFDVNGNQLSYPDHYIMSRGGTWRPNAPFRATMKIVDMQRGRSAMQFILEDDQGHKYTMFAKDMLNLIQQFGVTMGKATPSMWAFVKRGANYGLTAI